MTTPGTDIHTQPPRERAAAMRLYKFVCRPAEESDVRRALGNAPETLGDVSCSAVFRGSSVYLLLAGAGDPWAALAADAKGKKLLDALAKHANYAEDSREDARHLLRFPNDERDRLTAPARVALVATAASPRDVFEASLDLVPESAFAALGPGTVAAFSDAGDAASAAELVLVSSAPEDAFVAALCGEPAASPLRHALAACTSFDPRVPERDVVREVHHLGGPAKAR